MSKVGTTAFTFPVGKSGAGLHTIGIGTPSASATVTASTSFQPPCFWLHRRLADPDQRLRILDTQPYCGNRNRSCRTFWESTSACGGTQGYVGSLWTGCSPSEREEPGRMKVASGQREYRLRNADFQHSDPRFHCDLCTWHDDHQQCPAGDVCRCKAFQKNSGVQVEWTNA